MGAFDRMAFATTSFLSRRRSHVPLQAAYPRRPRGHHGHAHRRQEHRRHRRRRRSRQADRFPRGKEGREGAVIEAVRLSRLEGAIQLRGAQAPVREAPRARGSGHVRRGRRAAPQRAALPGADRGEARPRAGLVAGGRRRDMPGDAFRHARRAAAGPREGAEEAPPPGKAQEAPGREGPQGSDARLPRHIGEAAGGKREGRDRRLGVRDTVLGKEGGSRLAANVDGKSGYLAARKAGRKASADVAEVMIGSLGGMPLHSAREKDLTGPWENLLTVGWKESLPSCGKNSLTLTLAIRLRMNRPKQGPGGLYGVNALASRPCNGDICAQKIERRWRRHDLLFSVLPKV